MITDVVHQVLARFGLDVADCRASRCPGGFSGAVVYRVETSQRTLALRAWPPDDLPSSRLRGLHRLLEHVGLAGVELVAVPLRAADGDTLVSIGGREWQLEPWLPGTARLVDDPTPHRLGSAVRALAGFHLAAVSHVAESSAREWFGRRPPGPVPAVVERLGRIDCWADGRLSVVRELMAGEPTRFAELGRLVVAGFERSFSEVRRDLERFAREDFALQSCWRDLHREHVLFEGDRVTGLLDPSASRVENVGVDLARLLGDVVGDDESAREAAIVAYEEVRRLTVAELELVRVLDRSSVLLMGTTWLGRCYLTGQPVDSDPRVLARLERVVERLARLP